jgi:hypothetical protein
MWRTSSHCHCLLTLPIRVTSSSEHQAPQHGSVMVVLAIAATAMRPMVAVCNDKRKLITLAAQQHVGRGDWMLHAGGSSWQTSCT